MPHRALTISLITAALLTGAVVVWRSTPQTPQAQEASHTSITNIQRPPQTQLTNNTTSTLLTAIPTAPFIEPTDLEAAFLIAASTTRVTIPNTERPIAGLVNHHSLASPLIARFALDLHAALPNLEEVVILSPDHFSDGPGLSTQDHPYLVPNGQVEIDTNAVSDLIQRGVASYSPDLFKNEHGIGAVLPFIAHEYPTIRLLPLALRMNRPDAALTLKTALRDALDRPNTFVIISADMSHYLNGEAASAHDTQTLAWLTSCNEHDLWNATDDHLDSGRSVSTLCTVMRERKLAPTFRVTAHDLSTNYGGDPKSTTSYLTGFWTTR